MERIALFPEVEIVNNLHGKRLKLKTKTSAKIADSIAAFKRNMVWPKNYHIIGGAKDLGRVASEISKHRYMAIDCETYGLHAWTGDLYCVSIWVGGHAYLINFKHPLLPQISYETAARALSSYMTDDTITKYGFNLPFDAHFLQVQGGWDIGYLHFDAYTADCLLEDDLPSYERKLKVLCDRLLGMSGPTYEQLFGSTAWIVADPQVAAYYALGDAEKHYKLSVFMEKQLLKTPSLHKIMHEMEMPFMNVLYRTERDGLPVDEEYLKGELAPKMDARLKEIEQELIAAGLPAEINPASPEQMAAWMFGPAGLPHIKGNSTGKDILEELKDRHPVIPIFIDYRETAKLKNAFVDNLANLVIKKKIHPSFNGLGTVTGRPSCKDPNLLNQPSKIGPVIRKAFIASPGKVLVSKDLTGQELRIIAHFAEDPGLTKATLAGTVYEEAAAVHYGGKAEDYTKHGPRRLLRDKGKRAVLAMNYGAQGKKMAWIFECSKAKGYQFVENYHKKFPGLKRYEEDCVEYAKKHGCIWTICGRRRTLDFKKAEMQNQAKVWQLERFAGNSPIQGSAADQLKLATIMCDNYLRENYPNSKVLFQIYDELLFEIDLWDLNNTQISEELDHIIVNALPLFNIEFATSTEVYAIGEDGYSRWGMTEDND